MEGLTTTVLVILGIVLLYRYLLMGGSRNSRIPGPRKYPLVGSALQLKTGRIHEQFYDYALQFGKLFEIQIFNTTCVVLNKVDAVNKTFCSEEYKHVFNHRPKVYVAKRLYFLNNMTMHVPDKQHGDLRKTLSRGLHIYGDGIAAFENIINEEIDRIIEQIETSKGQEFEAVGLVKRSLSNVMTILLIGESATETDVTNYNEFNTLLDYLASPIVNTLLLNLPFLCRSPLFKPQFEQIEGLREKIADRLFGRIKKTRIPGKIRGLIDWYLQEQQMEQEKEHGGETLFTDETIIANAMDVLAAGMLSTSAVLPSAILCLVHHPGYQTRIQEELDMVVGTDREPHIADKHNCHFLEAVVMETMRYLTPVPFLVPHVCSEDTTFEGFTIKANTQVLANIWYIHHDETIWGDPWTFRPDRFLDDNGKLVPNSHVLMKSWIPFGVGRRKCPGMGLATNRMFLYMARLFQKWSVIPSPGKCGSCDPRKGEFDCDLLFKPKPFYCIAKNRRVS